MLPLAEIGFGRDRFGVAFGSRIKENKMEKQEGIRIKEKLNFFYDEKCKVHISRFDNKFWRGFITGKKSDDVFEFNEDKLGECLLFVTDIHDVNMFREERV